MNEHLTTTAEAAAGATVGDGTTADCAGNILMTLNAHNLSAMIMKGSPQSSERDAGFCSGSSEGGDDISMDHARLDHSGPTSPTGSSTSTSSQDFVDVVSMVRNKRKINDPAQVTQLVIHKERQPTAPPKKRIRYTSTADSAVALTPPAIASPPLMAIIPTADEVSGFQSLTSISANPTPTATRGSAISAERIASVAAPTPMQPRLWNPFHYMPNPAHVFVRHPGVTTLHRPFASSSVVSHSSLSNSASPGSPGSPSSTPISVPLSMEIEQETEIDVVGSSEQAEPLNLVVVRSNRLHEETPKKALISVRKLACEYDSKKKAIEQQSAIRCPTAILPLPNSASERTRRPSYSDDSNPAFERSLSDFIPAQLCSRLELTGKMANSDHESTSCSLSSGGTSSNGSVRPQQRNYKNMTRERRIEANARERTRVHTISAAYETLRRSVPSYSDAQKLSKLSVLRIACTYIMALGRMAGHDYSADQSEPSVEECWEAVTRTIQNEGKLQKKRKDDQDENDDDDY